MPALVPELSVTDIADSQRFYCEIIGFSVLYERAEEGFVYLGLGAVEIMLDQLGQGRDWMTGALDAPFGRGVNFQIEVDAVAPLVERLNAADVVLFQPVEEKRYRVKGRIVTQRQFCVQDPDGYLLRFFEPVG